MGTGFAPKDKGCALLNERTASARNRNGMALAVAEVFGIFVGVAEVVVD
jgi:hypothetical protein